MTKLLYKILPIILIGVSAFANAQSDSVADKFNFKIGVYYNSNLNYYGRTDSLRSSGIFPLAELWFDQKFYINVAPVFTTNSVAGFQYAGAVSTAGFLMNNGKSVTHLYFVRPIYKESSHLVQSALKAQLAASFTRLNTFMNITAGADIKFSSNTDFGVTMAFDHIFRKKISAHAILIIDPSFNFYAGTQRFTQIKYKNNELVIIPEASQSITEEVKKFSILSFELSSPVILTKGKWMILATPAYVIPQNLVMVEDHPQLSERGKRMVYITAGAKLSF